MVPLLQKLETLMRIIYCEGRSGSNNNNNENNSNSNSNSNNNSNHNGNFEQMIMTVGLIFTLWNTILLVIDIGQGLKLIFSKYFIGGVLVLVGTVFGVVLRRRGDTLLKGDNNTNDNGGGGGGGNGLLWAPMGQDPEYYFSQLSIEKQYKLRMIFALLFTEVAIFLFQDSTLLQVWVWAEDEYNNPIYNANDTFDVISKWFTCISAACTFLLLSFTLIVACCHLHWMPGFCTKIQQIMKAIVFLLCFGITYLIILFLVIEQFHEATKGSTGETLVVVSGGESYSGSTYRTTTDDEDHNNNNNNDNDNDNDQQEQPKTNGASVLFSVCFTWMFGAFFSCKLRQQTSNPIPLVPSLITEEDQGQEGGRCNVRDDDDLEKGGSSESSSEDDDDDDDDQGNGQQRKSKIKAIKKKKKKKTKKNHSVGKRTSDVRNSKKKSSTRSSPPPPPPPPPPPDDDDDIDTKDVCLGCTSHSGSRCWYDTIQDSLEEFTDTKFSPEVYRYIKRKFNDKNNDDDDDDHNNTPPPPPQFWTYRNMKWQHSTKKEIVIDCRTSFDIEQHKLFDNLMKKDTKNDDGKEKKASKQEQEQKQKRPIQFPKNELAGTYDICFGCMVYPGTRSFFNAIEKALEKFPDDKFSQMIYRHIMDQFQGRKFWIYKNNNSKLRGDDGQWSEASEKEIRLNCLEIFNDAQSRLFEDIMMEDS